MQLQVATGAAQWTDGGEQRLLISMLLATLFVAALLSIARLPPIPDFAPLVELIVNVVRNAPDENPVLVEPQPVVDEMPLIDETPEVTGDDDVSAPQGLGQDMQPSVDVATASEKAINAYLDRLENPYSVNPVLAAKRRNFEGTYQPPSHVGPRPIWENVDVDQLGRTVLRSGDCYKVLDDPNVGSQDAFRDFGQYIAICTYQKRLPKNLPWVAELVERYHYLKYPDGYVPEEEAAE